MEISTSFLSQPRSVLTDIPRVLRRSQCELVQTDIISVEIVSSVSPVQMKVKAKLRHSDSPSQTHSSNVRVVAAPSARPSRSRATSELAARRDDPTSSAPSLHIVGLEVGHSEYNSL